MEICPSGLIVLQNQESGCSCSSDKTDGFYVETIHKNMTVFDNSQKSTVRGAFYIYGKEAKKLSLVSPFFSYSDLLQEFADGERIIRLIVRLGLCTPPEHLRNALRLPHVQIRFYTSEKFHSKLYIFEGLSAIVGSANLTQAGMQSNDEIAISVDKDHPDFDELTRAFTRYWDEAEVFRDQELEDYEQIFSSNPVNSDENNLVSKILEKFGDKKPPGGIRDDKGPVRREREIADYRRAYQEYFSALEEVRNIYQADGRRMQPSLPLWIEIDQFLSYIKEIHARTDEDASVRMGAERRKFIEENLDNWFAQRWPHLDNNVIDDFPKINRLIGSQRVIRESTMNDLLEALEICNAFQEAIKRRGGEPARRKFLENDPNKVRSSLSFLLHGEDGDIESRMGAVINDPRYKLEMVGANTVQELVGWIHSDIRPIINSRTVKALQFLGYDVPESN